jgi:hypothetical protein
MLFRPCFFLTKNIATWGAMKYGQDHMLTNEFTRYRL